MNFLSRLFKPSPSLPSVQHPKFGKMQAVIDYGNGMYYWEADGPVDTQLGNLEPSFDAPVEGPSEVQTNRWQEIVDNYPSHFLNAEHLLRENLAGFGDEGEFDRLKLISVDLHDRPDVEFEWAFAYELPKNGMIYTVLFANNNPKVVTVDG